MKIDQTINNKIANGIKKGMNLVLLKMDELIDEKVGLFLDQRLPMLESNINTNLILAVEHVLALEKQKTKHNRSGMALKEKRQSKHRKTGNDSSLPRRASVKELIAD